jgi:hypothetical protein
MNTRRTTLERAYDLATTGECSGILDIRTRLKAEGYDAVDAQLYGPGLTKALRRLCAAARSEQTSDG